MWAIHLLRGPLPAEDVVPSSQSARPVNIMQHPQPAKPIIQERTRKIWMSVIRQTYRKNVSDSQCTSCSKHSQNVTDVVEIPDVDWLLSNKYLNHDHQPDDSPCPSHPLSSSLVHFGTKSVVHLRCLTCRNCWDFEWDTDSRNLRRCLCP